MPRNLSSSFIAQLTSGTTYPAFFVTITLTTGPLYVWSGVGNYTYNGDTYTGLATLGSISAISESGEVEANGIVLTLGGIPSSLVTDALTDVQQGLPAQVLFALFNADGTLVDAVVAFNGFVDQPSIDIGPESVSISITCENRLADMNRAQCCRYTDTQQRSLYPNDQSHSWVNRIQDINLLWN